MPIAACQPGLDDTRERGSGSDVSTASPPADLLPPGGELVSAEAPAPHRALALDALCVVRTLRDHPRDVGPWGAPAFAREVELVRRHLAPIRDRRGLAASYGREAFRMRDARERGDPPGLRPSRVAYAIRWLELGDGVGRPGWTNLVTGRA
jgi:hypothetical protein